ncbi:hypothetical protein AAT17_11710 [Nonlabens sp. MIC269]|nr:hypothetical protein AAT17_11710 [Nonlabens sp. MIC269]
MEKKAFHFAVIQVVVFGIFIILSFIPRTVSNDISSWISYLMTFFAVIVIAGSIASLLSLKRPFTVKKFIVTIINFWFLIYLAYRWFLSEIPV